MKQKVEQGFEVGLDKIVFGISGHSDEGFRLVSIHRSKMYCWYRPSSFALWRAPCISDT